MLPTFAAVPGEDEMLDCSTTCASEAARGCAVSAECGVWRSEKNVFFAGRVCGLSSRSIGLSSRTICIAWAVPSIPQMKIARGNLHTISLLRSRVHDPTYSFATASTNKLEPNGL